MQDLFFIFFDLVFYTFSTVFNKVINIVSYLCERIQNISQGFAMWLSKTARGSSTLFYLDNYESNDITKYLNHHALYAI